jgi:PST family polysaccharide transporter
MHRTLTSAALAAIRWNYAGFLARSAAGVVVGIVLARLLGPKPFGELGIAAIIFGLGNQLADAGFSSALVQAPDLDDRRIRFVFTAQFLVGCAMTALTWSAAPVLGAAFRDAAAVAVIRAVSFQFVLQSLGQTATGLLKRNLRFKSIQAAQVLSYLIGYAAVGITMACTGFGVWSLVAAQLVQPLLYSAIVYATVRHSVRPVFDRGGLRLVRFGTQVTGANLINWTISNLDNIFVARAFGSTSLGLYSRSFNLASNPVEGLVSTCQQVLFASCSRVDQRLDRMGRAYLAALGAVALITMTVFWSLAACGHFVIAGLLGPRWTEAAPLFTAFAVAMPLFALMAVAGPVLGAADRVSQEIRTQAASLVVAFVLFLSTAQVSVQAIAWAVVVAYAFRFWCTTRPTLRLVGLRWSNVASAVTGPACAALFTTLCVFLASRTVVGNSTQPVVALLALGAVAALSFITIALIAGRHVLPRAVLDPLLANATEFPNFVSRPLTTLAARWHPSVRAFPGELSTAPAAAKH